MRVFNQIGRWLANTAQYLKPPALEVPGFGQYCAGQGLSIIGTGMQCVLVPWYVYYETRSPLALALVAVTTALSLCLCPYGGVIADRYNRWAILIISQWVALFQALALGIIAFTGAFNLWLVLVLNFLAGTITAFEFPARQAFKSELVGEDKLAAALGFYNSIDGTAFALGQAIGGVMIVSITSNAAAICFSVNTLSYLAALWALLAVRPLALLKPIEHEVNTGNSAKPETKLSIIDGLSLVRGDRVVLFLMLQTAAVVIFCKRLDPLLPAYAEAGLKNVAGTGWLKVGIVIGSIVGGLWMGRKITDKEAQWQWSYRTMLALPVVLVLFFAIAWEPVTASLAVSIMAAVLLVQDSCCAASIQTSVAPSMRGRVISWRVSVNWGLDLLMAMPLAWAATRHGVRPVLITCAVMGALVAIALWFFAKPKATAKQHHQMSAEPATR